MSQSQIKIGFFVISAVLFSIVYVLGLKTNSAQPEEHESPTSTPECRNESQAEVFSEPKRIVWTGRPIGLMVSGWGIALQKVPLEDGEIPYFAAYMPDEGPAIADEILHSDQLVRVEGLWTDVSSQYGSIFANFCVPTVEIESIELVPNVLFYSL